MRPFELTLLVAGIVFVVIGWRSASRHWTGAAALLVLLIVGLHFWLEGWRWQAIPLYLVAILACWRLPKDHPMGTGAAAAGMLLAALGGLLLWALPVITTPSLSGAYPVGVMHAHWTDESRVESRGELPGVRQLMVSIWYPADSRSGTPRSDYLPDFEMLAGDYAGKLGWPAWLLEYLKYSSAQARVAAPALQQKFPLILYSHGLNRNRFEAVSRMEMLASHGFVVVAVDHPYGADFVRFPDGRIERFVNKRNWDDSLADIDRKRLERLNIWVADLAFVLDRLQIEPDYPWRSADLNRVAAAGFSNGGSAALLLAQRDARIRAAVNLDGTPRGEVVDAGMRQPVMMMQSEPPQATDGQLAQWGITREQFHAPMEQLQRRMQTIADNASAPAYILRITGTQHANFTDGPMLSPLSSQLGIGGKINSERAAEIVDTYLLAFLQSVFSDETSVLLDSDLEQPAFPEVVWLSDS